MANKVQIKRGGSTPSIGILDAGELGWDYNSKILYVGNGLDSAPTSISTQGSNGPTGATGATGAKGQTGTAGNTGATGAKGSTGNTGNTGTTGASGTKGSNGSIGTTGTGGSTGPRGQGLELLWTNSSLTGDSGYEISLSLSSYSAILIEFQTNNTNLDDYGTHKSSSIFPIPESGSTNYTHIDNGWAGTYMCLRIVTISSSKVVQNTAYYGDRYGNEAGPTIYNAMLPIYRIYGIKK